MTGNSTKRFLNNLLILSHLSASCEAGHVEVNFYPKGESHTVFDGWAVKGRNDAKWFA